MCTNKGLTAACCGRILRPYTLSLLDIGKKMTFNSVESFDWTLVSVLSVLSEDNLLVLLKLSLKSIVRVDVWSQDAQVLEGIRVAHAFHLNQVADYEAGRAGVAIVAMHEYNTPFRPAFSNEPESFVEIRYDLGRWHVADGDSSVDELVRKAFGNFDCDVEDVRDVVVL